MANGWIKLYKKFMDWQWYTHPHAVRLFLHCLLKANYEDKNWQGITVKRGQFITSYDKLAEELQLSKMQIRNTLDKLKVTHEITHQTTNRYGIITVTKYDDYQSDNTPDNTQITLNVTGKQHSNNIQITPTKNKKNIKNNKKIRIRENTPSQIAESFFNNPEEITQELISKGYPEEGVKQEIQKFVLYWTEPNKSGTKVRWEMQKTFEVKRRLASWFSRTKSYQGGQNERKRSKREKKIAFPLREEVRAYCKERGYGSIADKVFNYYDVAGWKDGNGKAVLNWKQKLIAVWFKPENKTKEIQPTENKPYWE